MSEALKNELESIHSRYQFRFAGKPRITRNAGLLDGMIAEANDILRRASNLSEANGGEAKSLAKERIELYTNEQKAVTDAQAGGPNAVLASILATQANAVFARYRRHFAGKDRGTRDLGLLSEMRSDLVDLKGRMTALATNFDSEGLKSDIQTVTQNADLYDTEYREIESSRVTGEVSDRVGRLAGAANNQFAIYTAHFAGKSRISRRPELIERMITELDGILEAMTELSGVEDNATNTTNMGIVRERAATYRTELTAIREAKEATNVDELIGKLGEAANEAFQLFDKEFAGQDRRTRDLDRLNVIVDTLGDVERQMSRIDRAYKDARNAENLSIVRDAIVMFDDEYTKVRDAQTAS